MASSKSVVLLPLLVVISALLMAPCVVEAQLLNNIINITGTVSATVPCSLNTTLSPNNTLIGNAFRNTAVQLRCGISNSLVSTTTTDANGSFSITIDPPTGGFVTALVISIRTSRNCTAVVPTPLFTCNSTRPSNGTLVSSLTRGPIQRAGTTRTLFLFARDFRFNN